MPTAAKLVAAVMFAAVGFLAAQAYVPSLPEGTQIGFLREICAGLGLVIGWFVMGRLVGKGYVEAVGFGIRTSVTVLFWAVLGFSIYEMILRSTKMMYDGPMEALLGVFDLVIYYGKMMGSPEFIGTLLIGGVLGGIAAEWAGRRWS
ncbi:MAG: tellurium resistance protein [Rhodobacterales bacterium RIFCSPHIGHO2_02_FULL_62_130]|jgi:hypothetical protein|nr:MAG: tellurium resistance protein [Rhodobacterales bacterium RIFCSPHIGHO2_02_FULL_62_130]OHC55163.1 MAG: tellurium resistance protein [Rhodobacterales bacterium RIFCSPHIGHO2_12_FULL_62_75]HCZ00475.1 tellurium resistance protein [Rhodobacter sp.]